MKPISSLLPAPQVTTVSPLSMPADSTINQTLTINGNNFQSGATLTFDPPTGSNINSTASKLTFVSSNRFSYELNNGGDAGTWTVTVRNPDGQTSNAASFMVTALSQAPQVTTLSPTSMPADSTINQTLVINGSFFKDGASLIFDPPTGSNINSTASKLTFLSSTRLSYQLNNGGDAGTWTVRVRNPDGQISNAASFIVTALSQAPQISTVSPTSMPADSTINQTLVINGSFFKDGASLTFDPPNGSNINSTATKLTFLSSSRLSYELNNGGDVGTWTVRVNNPDGQTSNAVSFNVTGVAPAPTISTVTPGSMPADSTINQTLTINGANFQSGALLIFDPPTGPNINSTASKLTFVSSNRFSYELNNGGDAGTWTVTVRNPDNKSSNAVSFMVTASSPAPQITTVTPGSMPADSTINQTLTINGGNFKSGATLTFDPPTGANINSTASKLTFVSSNRFSYELNNGGDVGTWTVRVNNPDGQSSNAVGFTVTGVAPAPQITTVLPTSMPANSTINQTLTINGNNFQSGAMLIFDPPTGPNINSTANKLTFVSSNQFTYQLNNGGDAGTWTVRVNNPDNQSSNAVSFGVTSPVALLQVNPASGPSGTSFVFAGSGYTPNSTATSMVTKPNGQTAGAPKYAVDGSGGVSFLITSQQSDLVGDWTFRLNDDSTGKQASTTAHYTSTPSSGTDQMYFTASTVDVTIPDNTQFAPNETQNKVWRIQNSGTNDWSNYRLVYISGLVNGNTSSLLSLTTSLSMNASAGQWINTPNLPIAAPNIPGTYYSYWQMQNGSGVQFGPVLYLKIRVVPKQGNALGFGSQSGHSGTKDSLTAKWVGNADPVDTATGNYNYAATDLRVPGRGLDVELSRSYNSQDVTVGPLGNGWSHSFNIFLTNVTATSASVHYSDGKVLDYVNQAGTSNFTSSYPGYYDRLVKNGDGTWTLKKTDQRNYQFDPSGKLMAIQDRNNNQIALSYSGGNLAQVTDTGGRTFNLAYSGSLLTAITDPIGRALHFSYDGSANLTSFQDARGNLNTYAYDSSNRLIKIVDGRQNNLVVNTYDSNNRVATQTNGRGNQWTFTFNADGSTSVADPLTQVTKYLHDTNFNMERTVDRNSNNLNVLYDEQNNRAQTSDLNSNYSSFVFDANGNVTTKTDPSLNSRLATYDTKNNPTQVTDEVGNKTQMSYDAKGNLATLTDALDNPASTTYDSFGQPISVTDANGNVTVRTYDAQGDLVSVKDALNNTTSYTHDAVGRRLTMIDGLGKTTKYTYDENDNLLTVTDSFNNVTSYNYDANNNRTSMRDARGNTTTYTYDENNSLVKETDPKGNFIQHTYDKLDRRVSTRDKRGNVTNFTYDNEGRLLSVSDPLTNTTSYVYDANGNRTKITDAKAQSTAFTYDALSRVTKIQDSLGNTIQKQYDAAGRLTKETDPRGNVTQFAYDAVGNLTQVNDAATGTAKYSYDKNRNRITQIDPNNHTSNLVYDKLNRLLSTTDPLSHTSSYTYDEVGSRISQTDSKGQTTRYTYDANNRLSLITYPDNSTVQFTRDSNGDVTRMVDSVGATNYVYDELNRLTGYTDPFSKTIGYQYDENGNIIRLTYPDGKQVSYQFDTNNRMISLSDWAGKTTSFQYDTTNLLTKVTYPNGVVTSLTYDNAGRLTAKSDAGISSYSFTLDPKGNRTSASITQPLANRLQNTTQSYTYDSANRIQNAGAATFGFDANGNMTAKTEAGQTTTYAYDFENRLTTVSGSSQYFYNGEGVRLQRIEGTTTTRYVVDVNHDLSQMLCETDANGAITAYYVYGLGLAYKVMPDGAHYYYHSDAIGSTIAMTDDARNIVNSYAYDPFGKVTNRVENTANPFQFVGQYGLMADGDGLTYVRARYYSPTLGRFLTRDALIGKDNDLQSLNRYAYALNNPVVLIDSDGKVVHLAVFAVAGAAIEVGKLYLYDRATGQHSSADQYIGAAVGGAFSGVCEAFAAGFICEASGSALGNLTGQSLDIFRGKQSGIDYKSLGIDALGDVGYALNLVRTPRDLSPDPVPTLVGPVQPRGSQAAPNPVGRPQKKH